MKGLSVRQPWAYLIVHGFKDVENRNWQTAFRGRVYIHAGKKVDLEGVNWMWENKYALGIQGIISEVCLLAHRWSQSGIIGEVDIMDCVMQSKSPWFVGPWGFVLASPTAYAKPIPYRGQPGLFEVMR